LEQLVNSIGNKIQVNGLKLSRLMLGTAQLGLAGYGINNRVECVDDQAMLGYCEQMGVNCYDTAHEYGDAEVKLGEFFKGKKPQPFIVSKLKIDLQLTSPLEIERQMVEKTESILSRLQLCSLPALLIHDPAMLHAYGDIVIQAMDRMKRNGLIQRGGISLGADDPVGQYNDFVRHFREEIIELVQLPLNLFDLRLLRCGALSDFNKEHKIIVVRSVFLQGLFFLNKQTLPELLRPYAAPLLEKLTEISFSEGIAIEQLAISYIRDLEGVDCLVIGAENQGQIAANLALLNGPTLTEQTKLKIEQTFSEVPNLLITPALWSR